MPIISIMTTEVGKKGKFKSSIRFDNANKIDNYNEGLRWGGKEKKKKKKKSKRNYKTSQNTRIINVFLESLLSESFPSLRVTVHLTSLGCCPILCSSLDLLWWQLRF